MFDDVAITYSWYFSVIVTKGERLWGQLVTREVLGAGRSCAREESGEFLAWEVQDGMISFLLRVEVGEVAFAYLTFFFFLCGGQAEARTKVDVRTLTTGSKV